MITGICSECGKYEITSYDGVGCINIECSKCVLSAESKNKALIRRKESKIKHDHRVLSLFSDYNNKYSKYKY